MQHNREKIHEKAEISSLNLLKEDISSPFFEIKLWINLNKFYSENWDFVLVSDAIEKSQQVQDLFIKKLKELNIQKETIQKIEIKTNWEMIVSYLNGEKKEDIVFHLLDDNEIFKWNIDELNQQRESQVLDTVNELEKTDKILQAMDYIFTKNDEEWWFWAINDKDILKTWKFWEEYRWKDLKYLKNAYEEAFSNIDSIDFEIFPQNVKDDILRQKKLYLEMIMWIWDKYEWAAKYLKIDEESFKKISQDLVNNLTIQNLLLLLKDFHTKIDENNFQSTSVERSYKLTMETLHRLTLDRLMQENASNEDILKFAKIVTGRWYYYDNSWQNLEIDDNLRDQNISNEAILFMMNREGWIIDKINEDWNINIVDEKVENKNPSSIVSDLENTFYEKFWEELRVTNYFRTMLNSSWYWDILDIWNLSYNELRYEQKVKISVLYRVLEKLNEGKSFWDKTKQMDYIWNKNYILEEFAWLFNEVAKDYRKEVTKNLEKAFWSWDIFDRDFYFWKRAKDLWLDWTDAEIFELFQEINWNWLFDLSDTSIDNLKTTWKFVWVLAIWIAVPFIVLPWAALVAQWAAAWAAATLASMALYPKWYDTMWEAFFDISSDLLVWTVTWVLWWALAARFGIPKDELVWLTKIEVIKKIFKTKSDILDPNWKIKEAWIFALDLTFLWLIPEVWRMMLVDKIYHSEGVFEEDNLEDSLE